VSDNRRDDNDEIKFRLISLFDVPDIESEEEVDVFVQVNWDQVTPKYPDDLNELP
jgi:hypothetical protein